jgi:hypothetical protein
VNLVEAQIRHSYCWPVDGLGGENLMKRQCVYNKFLIHFLGFEQSPLSLEGWCNLLGL